MDPESRAFGPSCWRTSIRNSASNALFDPVHASNFAGIPLRLQARLRAVSEGICYPLGMAAGGAVLLLAPSHAPQVLEYIMLIATIAAMLFVGVGVFTGSMIGPSLLTALGLTAEIGAPTSAAELRAAAEPSCRGHAAPRCGIACCHCSVTIPLASECATGSIGPIAERCGRCSPTRADATMAVQ